MKGCFQISARDIELHVVAPEQRPMERVLGSQMGDFVRALQEHGVAFPSSGHRNGDQWASCGARKRENARCRSRGRRSGCPAAFGAGRDSRGLMAEVQQHPSHPWGERLARRRQPGASSGGDRPCPHYRAARVHAPIGGRDGCGIAARCKLRQAEEHTMSHVEAVHILQPAAGARSERAPGGSAATKFPRRRCTTRRHLR